LLKLFVSINRALGTIFWIFRSMDYVYLKRSDRISVWQTLLLFSGGLFTLYLVFHLEASNDLEIYQQVFSWILLCSPILIMFGSLNIEIRLKSIGNALSLPYILMSLSYEPLFLISFFVHIFSWVEMELIVYRRMKQLKDFHFENCRDNRRREIDFNDIRCVMVFVSFEYAKDFTNANSTPSTDAVLDDFILWHRQHGNRQFLRSKLGPLLSHNLLTIPHDCTDFVQTFHSN
jgi:Phosphatidylinositolglycan class N (PIG-N)